MPYWHFFIRPWLFLIHLGLKHCHVLETINTSVLVAALNMSLPEARSFTPHYPGPQEPSFMLIRLGLLQKTLAVHHCTVNKQGDTAHTQRSIRMHLHRITTKVNPALAWMSTINHSCRQFILESCLKSQSSTFCSDGTVKVELSPSCLCEPHGEMIPRCQDKWFKYWHQIQQKERVAKEAWSICCRNFPTEWDFTSPGEFKAERDFTKSPTFIIYHLLRAKWGHVMKNKQVKPLDSTGNPLWFWFLKT